MKVEDDIEKAELLAKTFAEAHTQNNSLGYDWLTKTVNEQIRNYIKINNSPLIRISDINQITAEHHYLTNNIAESLATPYDINYYIKSRNSKKSAGFDKIPNFALKKLSSKFTETLTIIINHCYNLGYFPNHWKLAVIAPIHKTGKTPDLPTSYRQISLLSNISKIYEKFILQKIQNHCDVHNIISNNQFGFRAAHSTTHATVILKTDISLKLNQKIPTVACLLDVEKAFDTTWTEGVIFKLIKLKFNPHLTKTIHSFLTDELYQARVDNTHSKDIKKAREDLNVHLKLLIFKASKIKSTILG